MENNEFYYLVRVGKKGSFEFFVHKTKIDYSESHPEFITKSEERAQKNHGQSLKRLNERGGLGITEILANVFNKDSKWIMDNPQEQWQVDAIKLIVDNA